MYLRIYLRFIVLSALLTACASSNNLSADASFDLWCGPHLCKWTTDVGSVHQVPTWHERDYGVALDATPTQISQLGRPLRARCLQFDMIADVSPEAEVSIKLDYDDDQHIEFSEIVPSVNWKNVRFLVRTPESFSTVRVILRKEGQGRAVLAQVRTTVRSDCAGPLPTREDGAICESHGACSSGACLGGHCSECGAHGTCAEGQPCIEDAHCADRACTGGFCHACAKDHSCPTFMPCDKAEDCKSGNCVSDEWPSKQIEHAPNASRCGACAKDDDCTNEFCVAGTCVQCREDADCKDGKVCRWSHGLDADARSCVTTDEPRKRGELCDVAKECRGGLPCQGSDSGLLRCGGNCARDPTICKGVCGAPGITPVHQCALDDAGVCNEPAPENPLFAQPLDRVKTCYSADTSSGCDIDAQCDAGELCCFSYCNPADSNYRDSTGECIDRDRP